MCDKIFEFYIKPVIPVDMYPKLLLYYVQYGVINRYGINIIGKPPILMHIPPSERNLLYFLLLINSTY